MACHRRRSEVIRSPQFIETLEEDTASVEFGILSLSSRLNGDGASLLENESSPFGGACRLGYLYQLRLTRVENSIIQLKAMQHHSINRNNFVVPFSHHHCLENSVSSPAKRFSVT